MENEKYCKNCGREITNYCKKFCSRNCFLLYRSKNQHSYDNLYRRYEDMKGRCYRKSNCNYKHYGARGIKVCDEWLGKNGYKNFKKWALENGYKKELSIDRINNDKDYSPDNCRWTTKRIQNINKRPTMPNTSGFIGVRIHSDRKKYYGSVKINNKDYYTGMSEDIIIAAIMRNNYIIDNHLDNELNDLSKYADKYDMEIRYEQKPKIIGVLQYDLDMNFIKEFSNCKEASKKYNCCVSNIRNCCRGKSKTAKGFIWKYKKEVIKFDFAN